MSENATALDMTVVMSEMLEGMSVEGPQKDLAVQLLEVLSQGGNLGQMHHLNQKDFNLIYSAAHTFYQNGKYDKALPIFQFLTLYDHLTKKWWMGLGATFQMLQHHQKAVDAYAVATILDIEDPKPQLQAGYCLIALQKKAEARCALEGAVLCCRDDDPAHLVFKSQALALLNGLN